MPEREGPGGLTEGRRSTAVNGLGAGKGFPPEPGGGITLSPGADRRVHGEGKGDEDRACAVVAAWTAWEIWPGGSGW